MDGSQQHGIWLRELPGLDTKDMATITLKNIPDDLLRDLKDTAKNNHRSLNGEILFALQGHLMRKRKVLPEEVLKEIKRFRDQVMGTLGGEEIAKAVNEGRA